MQFYGPHEHRGSDFLLAVTLQKRACNAAFCPRGTRYLASYRLPKGGEAVFAMVAETCEVLAGKVEERTLSAAQVPPEISSGLLHFE